MRLYRRILLATLLAVGACGTTEPVFCTQEARAGINVTITDALSGNALAAGSTLTIREGDYVERSTEAFGNVIAGARERAGTYEVSIAREGYHIWTQSGVVVDEDECHVITVTLDVALEAISVP
ncbi:MAG: carboxypeptidase-like regulatory domain-containing protein [Longimicrobiales bacterium]